MEPKTIYFAGDIFDHKHLSGNALLAEELQKQGELQDFPVKPVLPQNLEQATSRSLDIRNNDLATLLNSDLAFFNFDGTDLDSGTVVEFVFAKMVDIPSVILRSDIRSAGDQDKVGDPWNLMASGYPRTEVSIWNAMSLYQSFGISGMHNYLGMQAVEYFRRAVDQNSIFKSANEILDIYVHALDMSGSGLEKYMLDNGFPSPEEIVERKIKNGLYKGVNV